LLENIKESLSSYIDNISRKTLSFKKTETPLQELKLLLLQNDVALEVAERICDLVAENLEGERVGRFKSTKNLVNFALKTAISELLNIEPINLINEIKKVNSQDSPYIICFLGVNGTGKTTTIAKFGNYLKKYNLRSVAAASDTFRAGAIEQLVTHMKNVGIKVITHKYKSDPSSVAYDAIEHAFARKINVVLIDTSGRQVSDSNLMNEMKKIVRVNKPHLVLFVGDSLAGNDALIQAKKFNDEVGIDASILTKLDADAKGGAALSIIYETKKPILAIGVGQGYDDLELFDANLFIEKILNLKSD
jgi:fused signal recognition particle receptor